MVLMIKLIITAALSIYIAAVSTTVKAKLSWAASTCTPRKLHSTGYVGQNSVTEVIRTLLSSNPISLTQAI